MGQRNKQATEIDNKTTDQDHRDLHLDDSHEILNASDTLPRRTKSTQSQSRVPSRSGTPPPLEIPKLDGTEQSQFLHDLYSFMQRIGQPLTKVPHLGYQELDLYKLYQLVISKGGMDEVTRKQEWKTVYQELGIPTMSTSASYNTRTNYKKYLYLYELEHCDFNDRRPAGEEPKFDIGEYVRIVSSNYEGQVFYAKVIKCRWRMEKNEYYIHYNGWSNSHDEWMIESVLDKLLPKEMDHPELLPNPQPNRSSRSNYIVGEPIHVSAEPRATRKSRKAQSYDSSENEDEEEEETSADTHYFARQLPIESSKGQSRLTRLKLRHRGRTDGRDLEIDGLPSRNSGFSQERIQSELAKLEDEKFLDYQLQSKPAILSTRNIHYQTDFETPGTFNPSLLETVDLCVPNIDNIVGKVSIAKVPEHNEDSPVNKAQVHLDRQQNISTLINEIKAVKKEYKRTKKLLNLYYGPSSESSSETTSSEGRYSRNAFNAINKSGLNLTVNDSPRYGKGSRKR